MVIVVSILFAYYFFDKTYTVKGEHKSDIVIKTESVDSAAVTQKGIEVDESKKGSGERKEESELSKVKS